jgi:hypothetical protein
MFSFQLNILLGKGKAGEGGERLQDDEKGVANVIVKRGLVSLGEGASKEMVAVGIGRLGAVGTGRGVGYR